MGKGSPQPTESKVTQTNLPEYVQPYFERLLQRTEAESKTPYVGYEDERLAGTTEETEASRQKIMDIVNAGLPALGTAQDYVTGAIDRFREGTGYQGSQLTGITQPEMFTGDVAQRYMDPYIQNVMERQKDAARRDFARTQAGRDADAVKAGAYGGSRQAVQQYLAEEGLQTQLGDIEAEGRQAAYTSAQKQFEADRTAAMRGEEMRLQQERAQEEISQAAEKLGMSAAEAMSMGADKLASLAERARAGDVDAAKLLEAVGKDIEAKQQTELDLAYQDFIRQRDYPREQLQFYSSILQGVPTSPSQEQATMTQVNPYQQLLGTGITGLSLYKALAS